MAKQFLHIRIDEEAKQTIEQAARRQGKSLTTFVLEAALKAAHRVPEEEVRPTARVRGVPKFFRGCCLEASRGGEWGYSHPAYHLAIHLDSEIPWDIDLDTWSENIEQLRAALDDDDDEAVWDWFVDHYPACMELIPRRRWKQFVQGVRYAQEQGRLG